jgi:adenosine deaminase
MRDLNALPKAELHIHIEGSLQPEMALAFAHRNGVTLPWGSAEELRRQYEFEDLQSFLDVYYAVLGAVQTEQDFFDLTAAYLEVAASQGMRHVDLFFDPQAHTTRGVPLRTVIAGISRALEDARTRLDVTGTLVMCFLRDRDPAEAMEILDELATDADLLARVTAVGLDSAESPYPPRLFTDVYARARTLGLRAVAHAGEEGPPAYIVEALDLRVERVDHGVRVMEDPELVRRLVVEGITLTVCPLSNVRLRVVEHLSEHPILTMLNAGLRVTVNSDDPAYFGGYVGDNFVALRKDLDLTDEQAAALAVNSIDGSFASEERKADLRERVADWLADGI